MVLSWDFYEENDDGLSMRSMRLLDLYDLKIETNSNEFVQEVVNEIIEVRHAKVLEEQRDLPSSRETYLAISK